MEFVYTTVTEYGLSHSPLENSLLKHLISLDPSKRKHKTSDRTLQEVVCCIPSISSHVEGMATLCDEWNLYIFEDVPNINTCAGSTATSSNHDSVHAESKGNSSGAESGQDMLKLDKNRWDKAFSQRTSAGDPKYKSLAKLLSGISTRECWCWAQLSTEVFFENQDNQCLESHKRRCWMG